MPFKPTILVTGATGKTGRATVTALLEKGYPVKAMAHRHDERSESLKKQGAEVFIGNMADHAHISAAMEGVQRAYFVAPWTPDQLHIAMTFAVAAAESNIEHIVAVTQWLSDPQHPAVSTREAYLSDQILAMLPNSSFTKINPGWFADNYMPPALIGVISQLGVFPFPLGTGKTAPVSNEDIGRVAAEALMRPEKHAGKTYRPTGPQLLAPEDIADAFSRVTGRPVKYQDIPMKMFLKALKYMDMPAHMQSQLRHYISDYQLGSFERDAPNDIVEAITGQPAEDFETIARRYFKAAPITEKCLSNKLRALKGFLTLAMKRPLDLESFEKQQNYPAVAKPRFAKAITQA